MPPMPAQRDFQTWQSRPMRAAAASAMPCLCGTTLATLVHERVMADMSRRQFLGGSAAMLAPFALGSTALGQDNAATAQPPRPLLLTNLRLFDGQQRQLRDGVQVLVEGQTITRILGAAEVVANAQVLDCQGKLLMPGLIDVHWHTMLAGIAQVQAMTSDIGYLYLAAGREA